MANIFFSCTTPASTGVVCAADANPHTVVQVTAPTNQQVRIDKVTLGFRGTTVTNSPIVVEMVRQTTAGSGGSSRTMQKLNQASETIQSTGLSGPSTEPTLSGEPMESWTIHPQLNGGFVLPLSREYIISGGGRVGIRIIDPQSNGCTVNGSLICEE